LLFVTSNHSSSSTPGAARRARSLSASGCGPEIVTRAGSFSARMMRALSTCTVASDTSG